MNPELRHRQAADPDGVRRADGPAPGQKPVIPCLNTSCGGNPLETLPLKKKPGKPCLLPCIGKPGSAVFWQKPRHRKCAPLGADTRNLRRLRTQGRRSFPACSRQNPVFPSTRNRMAAKLGLPLSLTAKHQSPGKFRRNIGEIPSDSILSHLPSRLIWPEGPAFWEGVRGRGNRGRNTGEMRRTKEKPEETMPLRKKTGNP